MLLVVGLSQGPNSSNLILLVLVIVLGGIIRVYARHVATVINLCLIHIIRRFASGLPFLLIVHLLQLFLRLLGSSRVPHDLSWGHYLRGRFELWLRWSSSYHLAPHWFVIVIEFIF